MSGNVVSRDECERPTPQTAPENVTTLVSALEGETHHHSTGVS